MKKLLNYGFERRAQRYAGWDREFYEKTRFFAAASLTNHVLGAVARMTFPKRLSPGACAILDRLGIALEFSNRRLAGRLVAERRCGISLDERMVDIEQCLVERFLAKTALAAPRGLHTVTAEIDGLLNLQAPLSICEALFPALCGYLTVIKRVRDEVTSPIQFAQQSHRVRIGQKLVACIRGGAIVLPV